MVTRPSGGQDLGETHGRDPSRWLLLGARILVFASWIGVVSALMVTDLWDESRGLVLADQLDFVELVRTTTVQDPTGEGVLFRPVPFVVFAAVAESLASFELVWRVMRAICAACVMASVLLLGQAIRRFGRRDVVPRLTMDVALLWSGAAVITASWFANLFDAMALLGVAAGIALLSRRAGLSAGLAIGVGVFCKEIALVALPVVAALGWAEVVPRRDAGRALVTAGASAIVYVVLRALIVPVGSMSDVHQLTVGGFLTALVRFPETVWWQIADVPVPGVGTALSVVALVTLRSWRLRAGAVAVWVAAGFMYGTLIHLGPSPLLSPDNFIGRLYLVPWALLVLLIAVGGRRWVLLLGLAPLTWGAWATVNHHLRFQSAYVAVYAAATTSAETPMRVDCRLYTEPFHHSLRGVEFGRFEDADWVLRLDGSLVRRPPGDRGGPGSGRAGGDESADRTLVGAPVGTRRALSGGHGGSRRAGQGVARVGGHRGTGRGPVDRSTVRRCERP